MTSALQRGSNLQNTVKKIMLIPDARQNQLSRKMKTPMFGERFISDNWRIILFDVLYNNWNKNKKKVKIDELMGKSSKSKKSEDLQLSFF